LSPSPEGVRELNTTARVKGLVTLVLDPAVSVVVHCNDCTAFAVAPYPSEKLVLLMLVVSAKAEEMKLRLSAPTDNANIAVILLPGMMFLFMILFSPIVFLRRPAFALKWNLYSTDA
jgi:hypothetical protein